jgi:osmotically-inducible protein OsmY
MKLITRLAALTLAPVLATRLSACADLEKCGIDGCPADKQITAKVNRLFSTHAELGPPGQITVQTINHVVYLDGQVYDGIERRAAESIAQQAPGVTKVVNSIAVSR